jgi:hypothetical protein
MPPYAGIKWLFWLAAIVLLLLAVLVAATVITIANSAWLFPAGVLALTLALVPVWGPPAS